MTDTSRYGHPHNPNGGLQRTARAVLVVLLLAIVAQIFTYRRASSAADNSDQVAKGNRLRACQSAAYVPVNQAILEGEKARVASLGLIISVIGSGTDRTAYLALAATAPKVKQDEDDALERRRQALEAYTAKIRQSVEHPDKFLADCQTTAP